MAVILASGSPRRKELMSHITDEFTVIVSDADESLPEGEGVEETVKNLALQKAQAVKLKCKETDIIISADTVVSCDGRILGKPNDEKEAYGMLKSLSGRTHAVYTGVCITKGDRTDVFAQKTLVEFYELSDEEINAYIATGDPFDKAGGYGIQSKGAVLVKGITGDYFNVVGFPVAEIHRRIKGFIK